MATPDRPTPTENSYIVKYANGVFLTILLSTSGLFEPFGLMDSDDMLCSFVIIKGGGEGRPRILTDVLWDYVGCLSVWFSYVEEKLLFPLFCCTETPVRCDAIDRLGCLVAICVGPECWVCILECVCVWNLQMNKRLLTVISDGVHLWWLLVEFSGRSVEVGVVW